MSEKMSLLEVSAEVASEVNRARAMWGTEFDEKNTLNDWVAFVNIYFANASKMGATSDDVKKGLRKAAGLVLSALYMAENDVLAPRHYDGKPRPESSPEIKSKG